MNSWHTLEVLLVALLVGGSAAFVLRALWRSLRTLSRPATTANGCTGCGSTCAARRDAAPGGD